MPETVTMPHPNCLDLPVKDIVWRYLGGATLDGLAAAYGCARRTVALRLKWAGIATRRSNVTRRVPEVVEQRMLAMYEAGISAPKVAAKYGYGEWVVYRTVRRLGGTIRPAHQGGQWQAGRVWLDASGHRRTMNRSGKITSVARTCWETLRSPIPHGYVVHHIDNNPLNDGIDNLACLPRGEHSSLHARQRREDIQWARENRPR